MSSWGGTLASIVAQEGEELLMAMAGLALGYDRRCCRAIHDVNGALEEHFWGGGATSQTLQRPAIGIAHGHRY
jgi:hypothetical protein